MLLFIVDTAFEFNILSYLERTILMINVHIFLHLL